MFAQQCIDTSMPSVRLADKAGYVLDLMDEFKLSHLAVAENGLFLGMITEAALQDADEGSTLLEHKEHFLQQAITEGTHLFDVMKRASEYSTYYLAVLSTEGEYLGLITPQKLLDTYIQYASLTSGGGCIVLELETKDYSLTEISRIVESNGAMILHSMLATSANQNYMQVSLKINKNDLKDIQLTFERYRYTVLAVLHQSEYEVQLKERFDSLMRYLEV